MSARASARRCAGVVESWVSGVRVNAARVSASTAPSTSSSSPVIAHIPFARADRRRQRLARCCSRVKSKWAGLWASATVCNTRRTSLASVAVARATTAGSAVGKSSMCGAAVRI
ncbi:MAG: hypothetical protein R2687_04635 [Candidatus Nanopelagicales bacterium]